MEARRNTWKPVFIQTIFRNKKALQFSSRKIFAYPSGRSLAGILGSSPTGAWMSVSRECCVLSGRGRCVCLITRPGKSYLVLFVWVWSWSCLKGRRWPGIGSQGHGKQKATCGTLYHDYLFNLLYNKYKYSPPLQKICCACSSEVLTCELRLW